MDWVDRPKNCKGLYGILQLLQGSHLDNFPQKTLKLGRVAFHSVIFQFQCLDFQYLINIRNSPQCPHVSAMGYGRTICRCENLARAQHSLQQLFEFRRVLARAFMALENLLLAWYKKQNAYCAMYTRWY